ncbi:MAG: XRE family transcriptional regulator [Pirellulales bacterium]
MPTVPSGATPIMLKWTRLRAGLEIKEVATAENLKSEEIEEWESGNRTPSLAVLGRLAKRYKFPKMVFYLESPPTDFTVVRDFRRLPAHVGQSMTPKLRFAIRSARERQAWASGFLEENNEPTCEIVGSIGTKANVTETAKRLRTLLGVSIEQQAFCHSRSSFSLWRRQCESLGVFVFQASGIAVEEMRGCAFSDKYAPAIVVNIRETSPPRTFTLIHELVHILLGDTSISAGSFRQPHRAVERFCDAVSAEVLMPSEDFRAFVPSGWQSNDDAVIADAARRYNVSRVAVLLKLLDEKLASQQYINEKWKAYTSTAMTSTPGRSSPYKKALNRTGEMFARLAFSAYESGEIHGGAFTELLGMKLKHLPKLMRTLYPNRVQPSTTAG